MNTPPFEPVRFLDQPPQNQQGEVARLIRHAVVATEKPVPALKGRIRLTLRRKSATRRRTVRALLVGGAIFISGGVVGAVVQPILRLRSQPKVESVENVGPASPARRVRTGRPARPPGVSAASELAIEPTETMAVLPTPAPTSEIPGPSAPAPMPEIPGPSAPAPTVERPAGVESAKAVRAEISRPKQSPERPAPAIRVSEPTRTPAVRHPIQLAMHEPSKSNPPAVTPVPLPLQPPAFNVTAPPAPVESASPVPLRPSSLLATPPAVASRPSPAAPAAAPAPAPAAPPASEQVLMARALSSLRVQRRPATALAALDEYEARFPKGSMLAEVARLRAEALLLLGQRRAALDELSREPAAGASMDEESRLVRGELRASAGRWREAFQDFDVLARAWLARASRAALSPKLQGRFERALWGRACARGQLGDEAGSRADLQELVFRFPHGRFAVQAAHRLGEPQPR